MRHLAVCRLSLSNSDFFNIFCRSTLALLQNLRLYLVNSVEQSTIFSFYNFVKFTAKVNGQNQQKSKASLIVSNFWHTKRTFGKVKVLL